MHIIRSKINQIKKTWSEKFGPKKAQFEIFQAETIDLSSYFKLTPMKNTGIKFATMLEYKRVENI